MTIEWIEQMKGDMLAGKEISSEQKKKVKQTINKVFAANTITKFGSFRELKQLRDGIFFNVEIDTGGKIKISKTAFMPFEGLANIEEYSQKPLPLELTQETLPHFIEMVDKIANMESLISNEPYSRVECGINEPFFSVMEHILNQVTPYGVIFSAIVEDEKKSIRYKYNYDYGKDEPPLMSINELKDSLRKKVEVKKDIEIVPIDNTIDCDHKNNTPKI